MWTDTQRQRLALEHAVLQSEGFTQFSVYRNSSSDTYHATGTTNSSSGRIYRLWIGIPDGYPYARPPMYLTEPFPTFAADGSRISALGVSHQMHTLAPSEAGHVQICHWRDARWHSDILLYKVFLKGLLWIEAYEQHLLTRRPIAEFVNTMSETA